MKKKTKYTLERCRSNGYNPFYFYAIYTPGGKCLIERLMEGEARLIVRHLNRLK